MKICSFDHGKFGLIEGDTVHEVTPPAHARLPAAVVLAAMSPAGLAALRAKGTQHPLARVSLGSPVPRPGKVIAAPVNYREHIKEMQANGQAHGHMLTDIRQAGLFLKASSSVIGPAAAIEQQFLERRTDHEIELCVVMGRAAKNVSASEALGYVAGYCLGLDITVRGPEDRSFRKSLDTYCVLGPWMTTADELARPDTVELELQVNGVTRQQANTSDMVLGVAELIEFASSFYTLEPGDVLMTGTPQGVGPIRPGDALRVRGEGLGEFTVKVVAA
jgi:2-keto-4-pentenoate hydratase/2-oxohepta-3-ene-1,7-dioic acid hydratase in catechol pathway